MSDKRLEVLSKTINSILNVLSENASEELFQKFKTIKEKLKQDIEDIEYNEWEEYMGEDL